MNARTVMAGFMMATSVACASEAHHKACMFAGTAFGAFIPAGYASEAHMLKGPDFVKWSYTNGAGSRITFVSGGVPPTEGTKTNLAGCAALDLRGKNTRRVVLDSAGFSHEELNKVGRPPKYDTLIQYEAKTDEDREHLDEAIESLFMKKEQGSIGIGSPIAEAPSLTTGRTDRVSGGSAVFEQ